MAFFYSTPKEVRGASKNYNFEKFKGDLVGKTADYVRKYVRNNLGTDAFSGATLTDEGIFLTMYFHLNWKVRFTVRFDENEKVSDVINEG